MPRYGKLHYPKGAYVERRELSDGRIEIVALPPGWRDRDLQANPENVDSGEQSGTQRPHQGGARQ